MTPPLRVLLAHGAGSSPGFVRATFAAPGVSVSSWWLSGHGGRDPGGWAGDLAEFEHLVRALRPHVVGGVSYGAHLAAHLAAQLAAQIAVRLAGVAGAPGTALAGAPVSALLLVMPAWTGATGGSVAAATASAADEISGVGLAEATERAARRSIDWVGQALRTSWPAHRATGLVPALRAVAASPAPELADLRRIRLPTTVVALASDPLHPASVATDWAAAIPGARLLTVDRLDARTLAAAGVWSPAAFA